MVVGVKVIDAAASGPLGYERFDPESGFVFALT